jgi:hypothetical protein
MLFKSFKSNFSLVLGNISMHHFNLIVDLVRQEERVSFYLCGAEDDGLSKTSVDQKNISQCLHPVVERTIDRNVIDILLGSIFKILG